VELRWSLGGAAAVKKNLMFRDQSDSVLDVSAPSHLLHDRMFVMNRRFQFLMSHCGVRNVSRRSAHSSPAFGNCSTGNGFTVYS
jgi:hypothetical protein